MEVAVMEARRYRKLPVEIEAIGPMDYDDLVPFKAFVGDENWRESAAGGTGHTFEVANHLDNQWLTVPNKTHHIAKGIKGEFYPIEANVLAETYEEI
jgi:hypothetical protein